MVKNDGTKTNEALFWQVFSSVYGEEKAKADESYFDAFYNSPDGFDKVREVMGFAPLASEAVLLVKELGLRPILATNPVFPSIATEKRIKWAGLSPEDFELITSYENSRHTKPNPAYYTDVAAALGVDPGACLMVGNDVGDDMAAEKVGMKVFLLDDCLINKGGEDISKYPHGSFTELLRYVESIR
jgi:FMN phosphatase YigB (HAD superfamily)